MPFHVNVPRPYPDELFSSAVARIADQYALQSARQVSEALYESPTVVVSALLPTRFGRLKWLIEERWGMTLSEAVLHHTLMPYYLSGAEDGGKALQRHLDGMRDDVPVYLEQSLGIAASTIPTPTCFRYCECCLEDDRNIYGETYWHRAHQLPGVMVCPEHGAPLRISEVPLKPVARSVLQTAERAIDLDRDPQEAVSAAWLPRATELARYCFEGLEQPIHAGGRWSSLRDQIRTGSGPQKRCDVRQLSRQFIAFIDPNHLQMLEGDWHPEQPLPWVLHILRKPKTMIQPMRFHAMRLFLDSLEKPDFDPAFGPGPWPCPNWLADHFGKAVPQSFSPVHDRRHPDRVIGRFSCSCGMVYTRYAGEASTRTNIRIRQFGPLFRHRAKKLQGEGKSIRAIAKALSVDWETARRFLTPQPERRPSAADRGRWLQLVADHPKGGVKFLRACDPALYARLYRRDRQWLKDHSPKSTIQTAAPERLDWSSRDAQWAEAVEIEARTLRKRDPRKRITRTAITRRLGIQSTVEKNLSRLPRTAEALKVLSEDSEAYRARRLCEVAEKMPHEPIWRLIRKAGLRFEGITPRVLEMAGLTGALGDG